MKVEKKSKVEHCFICGCSLNRNGNYDGKTPQGRSHATEHHLVAERFFGRSKTRKGEIRAAIFQKCPWDLERKKEVFCYDCHEVLLHNPVFTKDDLRSFAELVKQKNLSEGKKTASYEKLAGRIRLLQEVVQRGIQSLKADANRKS
ncbi:MAG: hypothetical protein ABSG80_13465 [Verrucomicrobiota bacterium]|jgi:hypothetical protein